MLDPKLTNKRALITGGSTGIGLGIAQALAREGVRLAIASRNPDPAGIESLRELGGDVFAISADVSTEAGVVRMFDETTETMGGVDLYINNSAVIKNESVTQVTAEAIEWTLQTNTLAAVYGCREAARHFIKQGSGCILVVGSTARMTPCPGELSYRLSKTGLKVVVEQMAVELSGFNIRANLLTPGHFPTRHTSGLSEENAVKLRREIPLGQFGDPSHDLGGAAVLLLSDHLSGYTTGAEWVVDGGLILRPIVFSSDEELRALNSPQ